MARFIEHSFAAEATPWVSFQRFARLSDDGIDNHHRPERLSVEQVRRALNCYLFNHNLPPDLRNEAFEKELEDQAYYHRRNATAKRSHTKTRIALYASLDIDVERIKSCIL